MKVFRLYVWGRWWKDFVGSDYNQKIDYRICRRKWMPTTYVICVLAGMELWCYGSH